MAKLSEAEDAQQVAPAKHSIWSIVGGLCVLILLGSIIACVILAAIRSNGLTEVQVRVESKDLEPKDHNLPLFKQKEALPDYEIVIIKHSGEKIKLGAKPNTSAIDGLNWTVSKSVSIADIASIRLQDQDKMISDTIVEVQCQESSVIEQGYHFEFTTARSVAVGIESFFGTPIGKAICAAVFLAIFLIVLSNFCA